MLCAVIRRIFLRISRRCTTAMTAVSSINASLLLNPVKWFVSTALYGWTSKGNDVMKRDSILSDLKTQRPYLLQEYGQKGEDGKRTVSCKKIFHIRADYDGYRWWNSIWPCNKEPVSYTHLDVYKRQRTGRVNC